MIMSKTEHTPEALVRFLVSLSEEHILFLRMYASMISYNGERWYHLPNYYRQVKENVFEVMPPDQVPKEIKSFTPDINAELLLALEECEEYFDGKADAEVYEFNFYPNKEMQLLIMIRNAINKAKQ